VAAPRAWREAAERWGPLVDREAHHYGVANGATLLLKIASGESGFNVHAVSSAGARGGAQFMPETRQEFLSKYGVDAWKGPDEAIHAAALFVKTLGFASYNPGGGQEYIDYIIKQPVSIAHPSGKPQGRRRPNSQPTRPREASSTESSSFGGDLIHIGLVGVLVLGGVGMVGLGATRMLGTAQRRTS
jgi:transglycosylase-like protein with SLT domain